jgi:hypothetical protein
MGLVALLLAPLLWLCQNGLRAPFVRNREGSRVTAVLFIVCTVGLRLHFTDVHTAPRDERMPSRR